MQMTDSEIVRRYKNAKNKPSQIKILSELNACSEEEIKSILLANGQLKESAKAEKTKEPAEQKQETEKTVKINRYRTAEELLSLPEEELTENEKSRLERIKAIPELVREILVREAGEYTRQIMEIEEKLGCINDYLNGEERSQ